MEFTQLSQLKNNKYIKQIIRFDYIVLFALMLLVLIFNYKFIIALFLAYFYSAVYFFISRIVKGVGVSFMHFFLVFVVGLCLLPGAVFVVLNYLQVL